MANPIARRFQASGIRVPTAMTRARNSAERIRSAASRRREMARRATPAVAALIGACVLGAAAEYFFDRRHGAGRRHLARARTVAKLRRRSRDALRRAKYLDGLAEGALYRAAHVLPGVGAHKEQPDDVTLADKVRSISFRVAHIPKGHVSINAENGVVCLRGQLESSEQIDELVAATRAIDGVKDVRNLLNAASTNARVATTSAEGS
jgi:osmotically-inducible protein OsmY